MGKGTPSESPGKAPLRLSRPTVGCYTAQMPPNPTVTLVNLPSREFHSRGVKTDLFGYGFYHLSQPGVSSLAWREFKKPWTSFR